MLRGKENDVERCAVGGRGVFMGVCAGQCVCVHRCVCVYKKGLHWQLSKNKILYLWKYSDIFVSILP